MRSRLFQKYLALAVLAVLPYHAFATCYVWASAWGPQYNTGTALCNAQLARLGPSYPYGITLNYANQAGYAFSGGTVTCDFTTTSSTGATSDLNQTNMGTPAASGTCPASCSTASGTYDVQTQGSPAAAGATVCGLDNCQYTYGPVSSFRSWAASSGGHQITSQTATTSGVACTGTPTPVGSKLDAGSPVADCQMLGSATTCVTQAATGTYCGTYNGDQVCVGAIPAGTCAAYASGGVACTVAAGSSPTTPPVPNNGTAGVPATPTAKLTDSISGTTTTTNYYSNAVVAASTNPTASSGVGPTGTSTGGAAGGTGTGSGTNAANGDCGAAGVSCTGTEPAALADSCSSSYETCMQNFWSSIQSAPIIAGVRALESDWPSAACPSYTVTLATIANHSFDYGTMMCNVWSTYALPVLSTMTMVCWSLLGIFILLSA